MSLPAYAEYKDSGVEWLGDVPKHWLHRKIAWDMPYTVGWTPPSGNSDYYDGDLPWVTIADMTSGNIEDTSTKITKKAVLDKGAKIIPKGSLLFSFKLSVGKIAFTKIDLYSNEAIAAFLKNGSVDLKYWSYAAPDFVPRYGRENIYGALLLNQELIGSVRFYAPPLPEQNTIARFLDHETAKIDALIAEQQRLIELLKEKRQAVISHAVTKGLDPNAPMKESGVAWLGDVPEHWVEIQLGRVCKQVSDGPHFSPKYVNDGIMFLSARNIGVDAWYLDDAKFISAEDYKEFCRRVIPERGDVLYTKGGTTGVARVVDLDMPFQVWVHVAVLKLRLKLALPDYIAFALNSHGCYEQAQLYTHGATNQDLGLTRMVKIWLALPSVKEQSAIVSFLNAASTKIDELISHAHQGIDLLKERRSALISAAVTGKIDVRGWQVPQQNLVEEVQ